jgi:hypothetical protein
MQEQSIVQYTEQVAGEIASRYASDPAAELDLWLRLAHQREAMVTQLYESSRIEARLKHEATGEIGGLIRAVVLSIWAHETSHTEFLASLRGAGGSSTALVELQGHAEGWVTERATSGNAFARLLIAVGSALGKVPEFARELSGMGLLELLEFNAELEATALMGYQRILQIAARFAATGESVGKFGFTFQYDVARIVGEEAFHRAAFVEMASWLRAGSGSSPALSAQSCTQALHRLCAENLSVAAVRRMAADEHPGLEEHIPADAAGADWVSSGGLGALFEAAGLAVPVRAARS